MGMREKKKYRIISFHTTTEAIAMEKKCGKMHIPGRLIPTPREISASCGLAWRMTEEEYMAYEEIINQLELEYDLSVCLMLLRWI